MTQTGEFLLILRELAIAEEELHHKDDALTRAGKVVGTERDYYQHFFDLEGR
jgi:hypothetical protein